jgi:hypothetical protein
MSATSVMVRAGDMISTPNRVATSSRRSGTVVVWRSTPVAGPYVPTSVRQLSPLRLVCRAGRRKQLEQRLGKGRSGDDHGGPGAQRRGLHGRAAVAGT